MEIDLSSLTNAQKQFYVQLLAQSDLEFTKKDNQFVAQFKVDPRDGNNQIKPLQPSRTTNKNFKHIPSDKDKQKGC